YDIFVSEPSHILESLVSVAHQSLFGDQYSFKDDIRQQGKPRFAVLNSSLLLIVKREEIDEGNCQCQKLDGVPAPPDGSPQMETLKDEIGNAREQRQLCED